VFNPISKRLKFGSHVGQLVVAKVTHERIDIMTTCV
jgi:hypothetical protein